MNAAVSINEESARKREIESLMAGMHALQKTDSLLVLMEGESEVIETEVGKITVSSYSEFEKLLLKNNKVEDLH